MTVTQLFENTAGRKTVWTKRGDVITKREVSAIHSILPRNKIETVKDNQKS